MLTCLAYCFLILSIFQVDRTLTMNVYHYQYKPHPYPSQQTNRMILNRQYYPVRYQKYEKNNSKLFIFHFE